MSKDTPKSEEKGKPKTINEFVLVDDNGIMSLVKDGYYCFCPFQQPVPKIEKIQTKVQQGTMVMEKAKCQSHCPHFTLKRDPQDETKNRVEITCGRGVIHSISEIQTQENNSTSGSVLQLHKP